MRKLAYLLLLPLFFASCDRTEKLAYDISHTIWTATGDDTAPDDYRQVLNFYDDSHVAYYTFRSSYGGSIEQIPSSNCWKGTYSVISSTDIAFNLVRSYDIGGFHISFEYEKGHILVGKEMTVYFNSEGKTSTCVFTKQ